MVLQKRNFLKKRKYTKEILINYFLRQDLLQKCSTPIFIYVCLYVVITYFYIKPKLIEKWPSQNVKMYSETQVHKIRFSASALTRDPIFPKKFGPQC